MESKQLAVKHFVNSTWVPSKFYYLCRFAGFLERSGMPYAIVGDTGKYAEEMFGDIDIVVGNEKSANIPQLVHRFAVEEKMQLVQILQHEITSYYCIITVDEVNNSSIFLLLDICTDYYCHGRKLLSYQEILAGRLPVRTIDNHLLYYIPNHDKEFIYYMIKKINKGNLCLNHMQHLSAEWRGDPVGCSKQLGRFFQQEGAERIASAAASMDWHPVVSSLPGLAKELAMRKQPAGADFFRELLRKTRRICSATGLHVVFLGPDGSGKSSVIEHVAKELAPAFRKTTIIHLRPGLGLTKKNAKKITDPHACLPRGLLGSLAKLLYLLLDYAFGYLFKIRPMLTRSTLIIFDRYYHDLLVDPKRYRYGGPMWLARLCRSAVPAADMIVLLSAPAQVFQHRKQEVPFEETARQCEEYPELMQTMKNTFIVDASLPMEQVTNQVTQAIKDFMATRTRNRFGL